MEKLYRFLELLENMKHIWNQFRDNLKKTIKSATIESSVESSFFEISTNTYKQEKSVRYPNGIYPRNLINCFKSTDGDKGILKNVNWFDSV